MASTVFAEGMGFFHTGSGGKGVAPADVCLSPPPPPAGPAPIPYVNSLSASDLTKGSQTVKIQGNETALEDQSEISTSTGNEAGTQGGNVVTHKTKGKGYFKLWSFTVQVEGKGVCRHGDLVGQNCGSDPFGCVDVAAVVNFLELPWVKPGKPCAEDYDRKDIQAKPNREQRAVVRGGPCWECGRKTSGRADRKNFTPDHQPPMALAWELGGCHDPDRFQEWANDPDTTVPHCKDCSDSQGGQTSWIVDFYIDNFKLLMKHVFR
ncbi:DUF4150 domain-containing protein [Caballeronia sp. GaOx3]|uniref:DUF4150 domain-containing protein n=1 Tax=Caballeronia sp. GaOx3 TaxID=2921740 RepID=UPI002028E367|nr:DUF4150 domain-containing protein [Caballeronia sp. GaOx3]